MTETGLLDGKEEIKTYLKNISNERLNQFIRDGMPVRYKQGGFMIAHKSNVEDWLIKYTRVRAEGE